MIATFSYFLSRCDMKKNLCLFFSTIKNCKKKTRSFIKLICSQSRINVIMLICMKMNYSFVIINLLSSRMCMTTRCFFFDFLFETLNTVRHTTKIKNSKNVNLKNHCILLLSCSLSNFLSITNRFRSSSE